MRVLSIFVGACLAFACSAAAVAACEIEYEVQPGDTLASIAVTAYGGGSYQLIYSRNAAKIANPSAPPVGETLIIPCIAGVPGMEPDVAALSQRMGRQANVAAPAGQAAAPVVANRPQGIVILAPNDGDRYANVDLPEGGMTPAIAARALAAAGWSAETVEFAFLDNRDEHISNLLPAAAFSVGLPWRRPDCTQPGFLTERDFSLCEFYAFSEPLFATVNGVFGNANALPGQEFGFTALRGSRICHPTGANIRDLAERGVTEAQANYVSAPTLEACFEALLAGQVDYVTGEASEAEFAIDAMGARDQVAEVAWLATSSTLHAIAPRDDPQAMAVLADIDAGMRKMQENGEWFAIVARYLSVK